MARWPPPRGEALKDPVSERMAARKYNNAPDGHITVKGKKLYLIAQITSPYRSASIDSMKRDQNVFDAVSKKQHEVIGAYRNGEAGDAPWAGNGR